MAIAALLALALGACGHDKNSLKAKDATTTTVDPDTPIASPTCSTDPNAVEVPICDDTLPIDIQYDRVEPEPGVGENIRPSAFESTTKEDGDLLVRYVSGVESCYVLDRVDVTETDREVNVTLQIGTRPGADVCIELAKYYEVLVPLDSPLGDRTVVDGSLPLQL